MPPVKIRDAEKRVQFRSRHSRRVLGCNTADPEPLPHMSSGGTVELARHFETLTSLVEQPTVIAVAAR